MPASGDAPRDAAPAHAQYRYAAFISYRHTGRDREWAKWLHAKLETYRVPKQIVAGGASARLGRVFRDEEELPASSDLSREIDTALELSRYLVVICSPRTPESKWVNQEIVRFRELGRHDQILAVLIEGEPGDSFPDALREIRQGVTDQPGLDRSQMEVVEPLAADVRPVADESRRSVRRLALLRIAAALLGRRFDELRQRDQERKTRRLVQVSTALLVLLLGVGLLAIFAFQQKQAADHQRAVAEARMLVSQGEAMFDRQPRQGLRAAAEGVARVPDDEERLTASLSARLRAMASAGRVMKISADVDTIHHGLPAFPFILVRNRYSDGTLLHAPDLRVIVRIGDLSARAPLRVTPSRQHFAISQENAEPAHRVWSTSTGRPIGRTGSLTDTTLMPEGRARFFVRDVGFSPLVERLDDASRVGREGFDIRRIAYERGAAAFALFYRDDENTRIPPPPDLFDLQSGALLHVLPESADAVWFSRDGAPYYAIVLGGARWQLRRTDLPEPVVADEPGRPRFIAFGAGASAPFWLAGFGDGTEIRRVEDGSLVDRIDEAFSDAAPVTGEVAWTVRDDAGSRSRVLVLQAERLRLIEAPDDARAPTPERAFIPVVGVAPLDEAERDRPPRHGSTRADGIYRVTEQDKELRRSVWRRGRDDRTVFIEDERPQAPAPFYIRRYYDHRDRDKEDLIRSELLRASDDSVVFGANDAIRRFGTDPAQGHVWLQLIDDDESELVLIRLADGAPVWGGAGRWISFLPDPEAGYFIVRSGPRGDSLRSLADGEQITALGGTLRQLDFRMSTGSRYFVAAFVDGHFELWADGEPPMMVRNLGFGLRGYLMLPGARLLIWYRNGNADVIDPAWLAQLAGRPGAGSAPELVEALCAGLLAGTPFVMPDRAGAPPLETRACAH